MPLINNFGKKPITLSFDEAVAIGAALRGQLFKDYFPLKDVIPLNIGIMEGKRQIFNVFLKQNTYIPCSNKKSFYSSYDYQSKVEMDVYEGNEFCENNTLLGNFLFFYF